MIDLDAIVNIYNKGDLIVTKKLFDKDNNELTGSALNGFYMDVYKADESGNPVGNPIGRAVTGANDSQGASVNGQAKFEGLPVYDENGSRISYVVKEVYTAGQADTYYTDNPNSSEHPVLISGGIPILTGISLSPREENSVTMARVSLRTASARL
jgi:hypothetical protein